MPKLYHRLRRSAVPIVSPWSKRPDPSANEISDADQITVGAFVYKAHRRHAVHEMFRPRCAKVIKAPYHLGAHLVIDVEYGSNLPPGERVMETLKLSTYGVIAYEGGGGWSQNLYLALLQAPAKTAEVA